jgi:phosphohistidine phosphatase
VKRLTLMRHADAQWKDPDMNDFARPLNRRGHAEAAAMARRLIELGLAPDLIVSSTARRAAMTAEIIADETSLPPRSTRYEEPLYLGGAEEILKRVRTIGPRVSHLMIIGHNPGISELARQLAPREDIEGLATAALCSVTFDLEQWSEVSPSLVRDSMCETPPSPSGLFSLFG